MKAILLGLALLTVQACAMTPDADAPDATIYVLRHAEKEAGGDPALNAAGRERAGRLTRQFAGVPLQAVYSTDYRRTRETAAGVAADHDLTVQIYEAGDLRGLVKTLRARGETALVVGHSNTVPETVQLLGGPYEPMMEEQYDRLYSVDLRTNRAGLTVAGGEPF